MIKISNCIKWQSWLEGFAIVVLTRSSMFGVSSYSLGLLVGIWLCVMVPESLQADCWETGCQPNSWATVGCQQYGRTESSRRPCNGGNHYTCCNTGGGNEVSPSGNLNRQGDLTWYNLGLTACGKWQTDNDMVAALAFGHFTTPNPNNDPMCGRKLKIVDPSSQKEIVVTVADKCEGCQMGDVDVSPAAFQKLRPLGAGRFKVKWDFV